MRERMDQQKARRDDSICSPTKGLDPSTIIVVYLLGATHDFGSCFPRLKGVGAKIQKNTLAGYLDRREPQGVGCENWCP
jgi:hypothetical protein